MNKGNSFGLRGSVTSSKGLEKVKEAHLDKDEFLDTFIINSIYLDELIERGYIKSGGGQLAIALYKLKNK